MSKIKLFLPFGCVLINLMLPKLLQASIIELGHNVLRRSFNFSHKPEELVIRHIATISKKSRPIFYKNNKRKVVPYTIRNFSTISEKEREYFKAKNSIVLEFPKKTIINFRQIDKKELIEVAKLRWQFQTEENSSLAIELKEGFIKDCLQALQDPLFTSCFTHFGAFDAANLIAVGSVHRILMVPRPGRIKDEFGYITNMYTLPKYRNQKIGGQIIQNIKEWATQQDFELLMLWPSDKSIPFYKYLGFKESGQPFIFKLRDY